MWGDLRKLKTIRWLPSRIKLHPPLLPPPRSLSTPIKPSQQRWKYWQKEKETQSEKLFRILERKVEAVKVEDWKTAPPTSKLRCHIYAPCPCIDSTIGVINSAGGGYCNGGKMEVKEEARMIGMDELCI